MDPDRREDFLRRWKRDSDRTRQRIRSQLRMEGVHCRVGLLDPSVRSCGSPRTRPTRDLALDHGHVVSRLAYLPQTRVDVSDDFEDLRATSPKPVSNTDKIKSEISLATKRVPTNPNAVAYSPYTQALIHRTHARLYDSPDRKYLEVTKRCLGFGEVDPPLSTSKRPEEFDSHRPGEVPGATKGSLAAGKSEEGKTRTVTQVPIVVSESGGERLIDIDSKEPHSHDDEPEVYPMSPRLSMADLEAPIRQAAPLLHRSNNRPLASTPRASVRPTASVSPWMLGSPAVWTVPSASISTVASRKECDPRVSRLQETTLHRVAPDASQHLLDASLPGSSAEPAGSPALHRSSMQFGSISTPPNWKNLRLIDTARGADVAAPSDANSRYRHHLMSDAIKRDIGFISSKAEERRTRPAFRP